MKTRRLTIWTATLIAALALALAGCDARNGDRAADKPAGAANLEDIIESRLDGDAQLKAADLDVDLNADETEVTLTGTVESQELRTRAVALAKQAKPTMVVVDKIDVRPREVSRAEYTEEQAREEREKARRDDDTIGDSLDDAWIHMKITAQLIGDADTPARKINVDVVDNVVTLRGMVETAEAKAEAERIARETEGVRRVNNQLRIGAAADKSARSSR